MGGGRAGQERLGELEEVPGLRARVQALEQARARLQADMRDKDAAAAAAADLKSVRRLMGRTFDLR